MDSTVHISNFILMKPSHDTKSVITFRVDSMTSQYVQGQPKTSKLSDFIYIMQDL